LANNTRKAAENMYEFSEALVSSGRNELIPVDKDLFGQFVGEWDFEWVDNRGGNGERHIKGEWIFSWILEGRAIQDVFICPSRAERNLHPQPDAEYGTTVRVYNPKTEAWDVFYGYPAQATLLEARKKDGRIELTEVLKKEMKWVFSDINPGSFHWQNIATNDGGLTWTISGELFATRRQ
jgi:hypothetical protein